MIPYTQERMMECHSQVNKARRLIATLMILAAFLLTLLIWRNGGFDAGGIVFILLFLIACCYLWLTARFHRRLESYHADCYQRLGKPQMFRDDLLHNFWPEIRFLFSAEHKSMNDATLSLQILTMRTIMVALFGALLWMSIGSIG